MKAAKIREQSDQELAQMLADSSKELYDLRLKKGSGAGGQPLKVRFLRRDVARLKTIIRERERGGRSNG